MSPLLGGGGGRFLPGGGGGNPPRVGGIGNPPWLGGAGSPRPGGGGGGPEFMSFCLPFTSEADDVRLGGRGFEFAFGIGNCGFPTEFSLGVSFCGLKAGGLLPGRPFCNVFGVDGLGPREPGGLKAGPPAPGGKKIHWKLWKTDKNTTF